jgi:Fe-S-cluster-containing dehydrogenase component
VRVCPRKALEKDEKTGSIKIDEEKCDGCAFCLRACDFGAITLHLDKKTVVICDLCEDMLPEFIDPEIGEPQPQCVEICPKDSVSLKSVSEIGQESRIDAVKRLLTEESRKNDE